MPEVQKRIASVKNYRLTSSAAKQKQNLAPTELLQEYIPNTDFLAIPIATSSNRDYIPSSFMKPNDGICSNQILLLPKASLYHFSVLSSSVHMIWVKRVAGRLKMDFRYSTELVYNNFPWPQNVDNKLKQKLEAAAQAILDARAKEKDATLEQLYDQTLMPLALRKAHEANDRLVMKAYGFDPSWSEDQIFTGLYRLYQQLIAAEVASKTK